MAATANEIEPTPATRYPTASGGPGPPSDLEETTEMAYDRMSVLTAMMDQGVIPVFFHPDAEVCKKVIQACANGGAKCIEFTNRGDFAPQIFLDVTRHFVLADPSVIMGVGS